MAGLLVLYARSFAGQSIRNAGGRDFDDYRLEIMARWYYQLQRADVVRVGSVASTAASFAVSNNRTLSDTRRALARRNITRGDFNRLQTQSAG